MVTKLFGYDAFRRRSVLERIEAGMPHRFTLLFADEPRRDAAAVLLERLAQELTCHATSGPEGGAGLEVASTFTPGTAAILRPLNALRAGGIEVHALELHDLVTDVDDRSLERAVEDWGRFANTGPYRLRLEKLAGTTLLETCLARMKEAPDDGAGRTSAWRFAVSCVAFTTPGAEERLLVEAAQAREREFAEALVAAANDRVTLSRLSGEPTAVPPEPLAALIGRRGYVSERAAQLAASIPAPLPDVVVEALCDVSRAGGERAAAALHALRQAAPSREVRETLEAALGPADPAAQAAALETFAELWATDARATWREFLASRSVPMRWAAEAVLGRHGTQEDLEDAVQHLGRLVRARSTLDMSPPRGNEIVDLLVRHWHHPVAKAGLDDLSARWDRLGDELRRWLTEHHPWLDPAARPDRPEERAAEPEEALIWPPPTIERNDDALTLWFDEGAAHADIRESFEALASGHPLVEVLDGDREFLNVRIASPDPESIVRGLWETAGTEGSRLV